MRQCLVPLIGLALMACQQAPAPSTAPAPAPQAAAPADLVIGDLRFSQAWARATLGANAVTAAYLSIANAGAVEDVLLSVGSPAPGVTVEMHESLEADGVRQMRRVPSLAVPAGGALELKPGGLHLMVFGAQLAEGAQVPITLTFARAGSVNLDVTARSGTGAETSAEAGPHAGHGSAAPGDAAHDHGSHP